MPQARRLRPYLAALSSVALSVAVVGFINARAALPTTLLLYLVPIIFAATRLGRGPAILAVITSILAHDVLFLEPVGTLSIARADEAVGLALLLLVAVVTAQLADTARRASEKEREAVVAWRSDQLKTALLHAVTHELRTPLASIKAGVSALRQQQASYTDEDRAELLAAVDEETDRMDRLVRNFLEASRLEAGALIPLKQPQDLGELLHAVVGRLRPLLAGRPLQLAIPEDFPLVAGDYTQIDEVLSNLIENAVRHTPPGTPLAVAVTRDGGMARVEVADHGPGVLAAERERLFRAFERGPTPASGSGLGLAIARGLVLAHGGSIWVDDMPGGGARFTFTLQLAAPPSPDAGEATS